MPADLIDCTRTRFPRFAESAISVEPLEKGGSDRRYYRMAVGDGPSLILTKYGSQREENRHYVTIARFLHGLGVRVPEIFFHDEQENLIWMEDLGDRDLWSFREEPWPVRRGWYQAALQQILALHTRGHVAAARPHLQAEFNEELYLWEQNYFVENCLGRHFGLPAHTLEEECGHERLRAIAAELAALPRVLVHRDFQSQNIVITGLEAGLIDFQGMRPGLPQYDLASLLYDPYVTLTEEEREELLACYVQEAGLRAEEARFREVFYLCAMQRLMQALGAYGFLGLVKERPHFLEHIPAALRNLRTVVARVDGLSCLGGLLAPLG